MSHSVNRKTGESMLTAGMFVSDRYEIIEKIGAGGMSDVFKARDHILGRNVAIKVLKQEFAADVNFVTKFRTEAQSAAGLEHPNIVNIYDVGSEEGIYFIVMEYVEGVTLKTYIEKKVQLTYKEAVSIAIQVGRGIEAAHAKHIIHRDIKPQNILISTEGKAKVTDFGIARAVSSNTISADVMGSVHYSSPEQARNGFVDGKSDIYSLGIVMYEMVTGRVPFDGDTTVAVAIQHLQEEMVPPSNYAPNLPVSLEKIILKCTQKSPDRRYDSISDLLIDLKKVLISPNDDFVTMGTEDNQDKTRVVSQEEVAQIKQVRPARPAKQSHVSKREEAEEEYGYDYEEEEDDEEEDDGFLNPKMEKAVTIGGIVAGLIIVAILIYFFGHMAGVFGGGSKKPKKDKEEKEAIVTEQETKEDVEMISVLGLTMDEAKEKLHEKKIGIRQAGTQASDEYPEGQIVSQDIESGEEVPINTTVNVYISSGAGSISVTSVLGISEQEAKNTLTAQGFLVSTSQSYSDTVEEGKVISQTPGGGASAKKGDTVNLVISSGKEVKKVVVPDVVNKGKQEAVNMLTNAGLTVTSTSTDYSDNIAEGNVISQSIAKDQSVDEGTNISLVISLGSRVTKYYCNAKITAPDSSEVKSADITLRDASGQVLQIWSGIDIGKFPYTISVSDIESSDRGTLDITWHLSDGTAQEQHENVTFTKQ